MADYVELYHHGIKGQKWGVRRYQNKDGSLTEEGKKRNKEGSSSPNKMTTKQKVIIGASIAAGALAIYGGYKLSNSRYIDRTMNVGKNFYRQGHTNESTEGLNELIYATFKKSDAAKYKKMVDGTDYLIKSSNKVKVAGTKNAERIFKEVVANNEEFRSHYGNMSYKDFNGSLGFANSMIIEQNKLFGKKLNDSYMKPFFEALAAKGYGALVDTQDGFAKVPVILINSVNNYRIVNG